MRELVVQHLLMNRRPEKQASLVDWQPVLLCVLFTCWVGSRLVCSLFHQVRTSCILTSICSYFRMKRLMVSISQETRRRNVLHHSGLENMRASVLAAARESREPTGILLYNEEQSTRNAVFIYIFINKEQTSQHSVGGSCCLLWNRTPLSVIGIGKFWKVRPEQINYSDRKDCNLVFVEDVMASAVVAAWFIVITTISRSARGGFVDYIFKAVSPPWWLCMMSPI